MTLTALVMSAILMQADFAAELKALEDGYNKANGEYRAARTLETRRAALEKRDAHLPQFKDLAQRAKGHEAAEGALAWTFRTANEQHEGDIARWSAETLQASHASSPKLAAVAAGLQYAGNSGWTWAKDWLRRATQSEQGETRAAAMFSLAFMLASASNATKEDKDEARKLLTTVQTNHPDTPQGKRAEAQRFEFDHLQIGCEAPDFEATDVEGKKFKLSDYRGKVVVIDFWGFW